MSARYQILASGGVFDHQKKEIVLPIKSSAEWTEYLAALSSGEIPLPPDTTGQLPLDEAKGQRVAEINAYASGLRNSMVVGKSSGEMASWTLKTLDAMAVKSGGASPFAALMPTLGTMLGLPSVPLSINDALGTVRGIGEIAHADKVLAQAIPYLAAEIAIDAVRGKHCDNVRAMADVRDIVTYDWRAGWPATFEGA